MKFIAIMIYSCHACDAISHFCFLSLSLILHASFYVNHAWMPVCVFSALIWPGCPENLCQIIYVFDTKRQ